MADERERPEVDGWTTSGYGIILIGKPVKPIQEDQEETDVDEIEEIEEG